LVKISPEYKNPAEHRKPPYADVLMARIIRKLKKLSGILRPFRVVAFRSYGCDDTAVICGRVIENLQIQPPQKEDVWWRNLQNMLRVFLRARAEKAVLTASIDGELIPITTDDIGYFWVEISLQKKLAGPGWIEVDYQLEPLGEYARIKSQHGRCLSLPSTSPRSAGIISDIDDTILTTYATDLLMSAKMTFINNSTTRIAIEGMAELYKTIVRQSPLLSPIFYITSSSWSLYDLISDFLNLQDFPDGPLLMQKIGMTNNKLIRKGHNHKTQKIETILRITKNQSFYLFGDNGQADREIYYDIASRFPDRISAVCIRVAREKARHYSADYESLGIPYFEFENGSSLHKQFIEEGMLLQSGYATQDIKEENPGEE
jgi:phosphatidate phosphatase APP1